MELADLKKAGEAPEWMQEPGFETLRNGYLLPNETPNQMYRRVANSAAKYLKMPELANKFYSYMIKNYLCLASPVCSNAGTDRGLPISCFGSAVPDTLSGIFMSYHETAMLSKHGGGTSKYWGLLRGRGELIKGNGSSDGIIPWLKTEESTIQSVSQGGVRRGSAAQYLPIESPDIEEFIDIRRNTGDIARRCQANSFHHGVSIPDSFMSDCVNGNTKSRSLWEKILTARIEMGEPYLFFRDTVNNNNPEGYKRNGLSVKASNLCTEITLHSDEEHTFVCCLSSLNLARWDEWKDTDLVETAIYFLDGIMEEFISKASNIVGFEKAVRFAKKSRALGLGVLGWHTLLQSKMIPFESFEAMKLNNEIFRTIDERSLIASKRLGSEQGIPEWCIDTRNSHRLSVAPTYSNALISGGLSQGIEPIVANVFAMKTAKGTFITKNRNLERLLEAKGKNTQEVWDQINNRMGSVAGLDFLSEEERSVFLTARELDQMSIIRQAAQRQKYIDQSQSVNLFFAAPDGLGETDRKKLGEYVHNVHWQAWELGLKTLYYCRPSAVLSGDKVYREEGDCRSCEG